MNKKFYSEKQTALSAALAGPIPAGILIYLNYRALGKEKEALVTLIATVLLFFIIFQIPEETIHKIPNIVFTAFYGLFVYWFYHRYMVDDILKAMDEGGQKGSHWTVVGVSIIGLVITLAIIFGMASVQPFYPGEVIQQNGNELFYDSDIPYEDAQKLVNVLSEKDFFGPDYGNIARLELINDEYRITLVFDSEFWSDSEVISYFTSIKWLMEIEFDRKTNMRLESVSLSGKSSFKEIT